MGFVYICTNYKSLILTNNKSQESQGKQTVETYGRVLTNAYVTKQTPMIEKYEGLFLNTEDILVCLDDSYTTDKLRAVAATRTCLQERASRYIGDAM